MARIFVDIDGTLCSQRDDGQYQHARPETQEHFAMIEWVREKFRAGNEVVLWSARGSGSGEDWESVTRKQMENWGVPYSRLSVGEKPVYDYIVDDRALAPEDVLDGNPYEEY